MESEWRASRRRIGEDERELFDGLVPPLLRCWVVDKPSGNQSFQQDFSYPLVGPIVDWSRVAHCRCAPVKIKSKELLSPKATEGLLSVKEEF